MNDTFSISTKRLLSIRDASSKVSYSKDYITRLAREKKIVASWMGRQWFVDVESLKAYEQSVQFEQQLRQQRLSNERRLERELRDRLSKQADHRIEKQNTAPKRAVVVVVATLLGGVFFSSGLLNAVIDRAAPGAPTQVASVAETQTTVPVTWLPKEGVVPHFVSVSTTTRATTTAVVLLPVGDSADGISAEALFSDEVTTVQQEDGAQVLVAIDSQTGEERVLPILTIPVLPGVALRNSDPIPAYE